MLPELRGEARGGMDIEQLANLSQTDKTNRRESKAVIYQRVVQELVDVDLDAEDTLKQMKEHDMIISGSVSIHVVIGHTFQAGDIDFFGKSKGAAAFHQWVMKNTKYQDITTQRRKEIKEKEGNGSRYINGRRDLWDVKWLVHEKGWKMNIVSTGDEEPMLSILDFDCSLVMNAITYAGVGCVFPEATCDKMGVWFYLDETDDTYKGRRVRERAKKYKDRGFSEVKFEEWIKGTDRTGKPNMNPHEKPTALWVAYPHFENAEAKKIVPKSYAVKFRV